MTIKLTRFQKWSIFIGAIVLAIIIFLSVFLTRQNFGNYSYKLPTLNTYNTQNALVPTTFAKPVEQSSSEVGSDEVTINEACSDEPSSEESCSNDYDDDDSEIMSLYDYKIINLRQVEPLSFPKLESVDKFTTKENAYKSSMKKLGNITTRQMLQKASGTFN